MFVNKVLLSLLIITVDILARVLFLQELQRQSRQYQRYLDFDLSLAQNFEADLTVLAILAGEPYLEHFAIRCGNTFQDTHKVKEKVKDKVRDKVRQ